MWISFSQNKRHWWKSNGIIPNCGTKSRWDTKIRNFWPISSYTSEMTQDSDIVTMACQQELIQNLPNSTFSNDLEWLLTTTDQPTSFLYLKWMKQVTSNLDHILNRACASKHDKWYWWSWSCDPCETVNTFYTFGGEVMRYWHGYLSGVRCNWIACGPADATATSSSLAPVKSKIVYLSGAGLPKLSWKKGHQMDIVVVVVVVAVVVVVVLYFCKSEPKHCKFGTYIVYGKYYLLLQMINQMIF